MAFIKLKPDTQAAPEEIMEFVNEKVAKYKQIRDLFFVDEIPVSAAGKVLKRELRERLRG